MPKMTPIDKFFTQLSQNTTLEYQPDMPVKSEFSRICGELGWGQESQEREDAYENLREALVLEFNHNYGVNVDEFDSWKNICKDIGIKPIPSSLEECREVSDTRRWPTYCEIDFSCDLQKVVHTHVNILDLVESKKTHKKVRVFTSVQDLSNYTKHTERFFPINHAKAGGVLRYLLRHILRPSIDRSRGTSGETHSKKSGKKKFEKTKSKKKKSGKKISGKART